MIKKLLLLLSAAIFVTGCSNIELKKSANNKLFDRKGFDGSKRKPLYNGKYIDRAKRNVVENNYEEDNYDMDEPDEYVDPYTQNRMMYSNMVRNEKSGKRRNQQLRSEPYPNIGHARDLAIVEDHDESNSDLKKELAEIRSILSSTKKDLAKYKCPLQDSSKPKVNQPPRLKKPVAKLPLHVKEDPIDESDDDNDVASNAHASEVDVKDSVSSTIPVSIQPHVVPSVEQAPAVQPNPAPEAEAPAPEAPAPQAATTAPIHNMINLAPAK